PGLALGDDLVSKFLFSELISPITKRTFSKLHNVALVNKGYRRFGEIQRVTNRATNQSLGAGGRNWLDSDSTIRSYLVAVLFIQQRDNLSCAFAAGQEFHTGIDIFGVLAKDHHVYVLRYADGRRNTIEVAYRSNASVQIEYLTERDVEASDSTAYRCCQGSFDRNHEFGDGFNRIVGQPLPKLIKSFFARKDFVPDDLAAAAVSFFDRCIKHAT